MTDATKAAMLQTASDLGQVQSAMERIADLEAALHLAFAKMDRARDILTDGKPRTDCNWGMLATEAIKHGLGWPMDRAALAGKAAPRLTDADRYQWLKPRLICADFQYGDPSEACCALVFEIPGDMPVSPDLDATINAAIEAKVRG